MAWVNQRRVSLFFEIPPRTRSIQVSAESPGMPHTHTQMKLRGTKSGPTLPAERPSMPGAKKKKKTAAVGMIPFAIQAQRQMLPR